MNSPSRAQPASRPSYILASALALCFLCAAEMLALRAPHTFSSVWLTLALAVLVGAAHGAAFSLAFTVMTRAPAFMHAVVWLGAALGAGHFVASRLGAYQRLQGPYASLAWQVLIGSFGLALALAVLVGLMQPTKTRPSGAALAWQARARLGFGVALAAASGAMFWADQRFYVGLYPVAHEALRATSWVLATFAVALVLAPFWTTLASRRVVLGVVLAALASGTWVSIRSPYAVQDLLMRTWSSTLVAGVRRAFDRDGDGYSAWLGGGDCDDRNPKINPGAHEIAGNGIDDNCLLGDAPIREKRGPWPSPASEPSPYDVVFVTVDTWRPDHLGVYNPLYGAKGRDTTPNLDAWSKQATVFRHAYTPGGWTSIALASAMRGLFPRRLEWTRYFETTYLRLVRRAELDKLGAGEQPQQMFPLAWHDPHPTLAQLLRRRGMRTVAVVHDGFSTMLTRGVGVERDFDAYREVEALARDRQDDSGVVELARGELERAPTTQRLFLWVHFFGPHSPNEVHAGTKTYGPGFVDGYDHELRYLDEQLPRLFAAIAARRVPTILVLTGDHGEVFSEPARMHGFAVSEQDIRVPLFLQVPGFAPSHVEQLVSTVDLFPTLLALTKTPAPTGLDGIDLTPFARDGAQARPRMLISETWRYDALGWPIVDLVAAFDGRRKIVRNLVGNTYHAFDQRDPFELPSHPSAKDDRALLDFLHTYIERTGGALAPID